MEDVCIYGEEIGVKVFFRLISKDTAYFLSFLYRPLLPVIRRTYRKTCENAFNHQPGTHFNFTWKTHTRRKSMYEITFASWRHEHGKKRQMLFWRNFATKFFNELQELGFGTLALAEEWKVTAYDEFGYNKWESFVV